MSKRTSPSPTLTPDELATLAESNGYFLQLDPEQWEIYAQFAAFPKGGAVDPNGTFRMTLVGSHEAVQDMVKVSLKQGESFHVVAFRQRDEAVVASGEAAGGDEHEGRWED